MSHFFDEHGVVSLYSGPRPNTSNCVTASVPLVVGRLIFPDNMIMVLLTLADLLSFWPRVFTVVRFAIRVRDSCDRYQFELTTAPVHVKLNASGATRQA